MNINETMYYERLYENSVRNSDRIDTLRNKIEKLINKYEEIETGTVNSKDELKSKIIGDLQSLL